MNAHKEKTITVSIVSGKITIPQEILQKLGVHDGDHLNLTVTKAGSLIIDNGPTAQAWHLAIKNIPKEVVDIDQQGHYDPKKSPEFDQWMREG